MIVINNKLHLTGTIAGHEILENVNSSDSPIDIVILIREYELEVKLMRSVP